MGKLERLLDRLLEEHDLVEYVQMKMPQESILLLPEEEKDSIKALETSATATEACLLNADRVTLNVTVFISFFE